MECREACYLLHHGHYSAFTRTDNVYAIANLALMTGNIGMESTNVNPLRGQNNVQGSTDMGCIPDQYPGYQKVNLSRIKTKFEKAWE